MEIYKYNNTMRHRFYTNRILTSLMMMHPKDIVLKLGCLRMEGDFDRVKCYHTRTHKYVFIALGIFNSNFEVV